MTSQADACRPRLRGRPCSNRHESRSVCAQFGHRRPSVRCRLSSGPRYSSRRQRRDTLRQDLAFLDERTLSHVIRAHRNLSFRERAAPVACEIAAAPGIRYCCLSVVASTGLRLSPVMSKASPQRHQLQLYSSRHESRRVCARTWHPCPTVRCRLSTAPARAVSSYPRSRARRGNAIFDALRRARLGSSHGRGALKAAFPRRAWEREG